MLHDATAATIKSSLADRQIETVVPCVILDQIISTRDTDSTTHLYALEVKYEISSDATGAEVTTTIIETVTSVEFETKVKSTVEMNVEIDQQSLEVTAPTGLPTNAPTVR